MQQKSSSLQAEPSKVRVPTNPDGFITVFEYFSLIDPKSSDSSFTSITDASYLYYVRMDNDHLPYQRVLFRQKIKLGWLTKTQH